MDKQSKKLALCGVSAALGVVIMLLGSALGLGMYLAPMLTGLLLAAAGRKAGGGYPVMLWVAVSLLCLIFVSDPEQGLMFIGLFGWYPIVRPGLQKLARALRIAAKLLLFNAAVIALETLLTRVLVPESLSAGLTVLLLALGNLTFLVYDLAIPRIAGLMEKYLGKLLR